LSPFAATAIIRAASSRTVRFETIIERNPPAMPTSAYRVGLGHDTHRLASDRALILGGVRIEHDRGLLGHSDADIVLHAITDALLGALALGDIGELFSDSDPANKDAESRVFLNKALQLVRDHGWSPVNVDVTIHAQRPKLASHKPAIRQSLVNLLALPLDAVSVKAKTGEQVGPVGREEAMSADAVVLLSRQSRVESREHVAK
jgi:2-C-methyl-D-erythritol 2,4-cyclodiphosphate synthase